MLFYGFFFFYFFFYGVACGWNGYSMYNISDFGSLILRIWFFDVVGFGSCGIVVAKADMW